MRAATVPAKSPAVPAVPLADVKSRKVRAELPTLAAAYRKQAEIRAAADEAMKLLMKDIYILGEMSGAPKIAGDGWVLHRQTNKTAKILPTKLLEQGVSIQIIQRATVTTESAPYYKVLGSKD